MKDELQNEIIIDLEKKLRNISRTIKLSGRKILKNYPITSPQFVALQVLTENHGMTIGELCHKIGLAFSTTTDLVDRMEKNGLVERMRDTVDRRVVRIRVLSKGDLIIREVIEKRQQYLKEILHTFPNEKTQQLNALLYELYNEMENYNKEIR
ncbi:MarR family winged helix-turn-helix transcriptional regulator [Virgibacillus sp. W0430]|uniref:MarR family winged helix-turn-helix transcriptional regulator n=1 Tax=Virgibacillus sp. W0430 TaxID=3391580 RepID=UPI003F4846EA